MRGTVLWSDFEGSRDRRYTRVLEAPTIGLPYLLVNDHPTKYDAKIAADVRTLLDRYDDAGWTIIENNELEAMVRATLPPGRIDAGLPMPEILQPTLANAELGGVLYISGPAADDPRSDRVTVSTIDLDLEEREEHAEVDVREEISEG